MARGGARARSGPPPDPDALRRDRKDDQAGWETLWPREGDTPRWPETLADPSVAELAMWAKEWRRPQAVKWEENGQEDEVAMYVRSFVEAGQVGAPAAARNGVIRMQETLGISITGLLRHRWRLGVERPDTGSAALEPRARAKFAVVQGGRDSAAA